MGHDRDRFCRPGGGAESLPLPHGAALPGQRGPSAGRDEAVYKGFRACGTLREEQYCDTWLTRILINVCNAELRRRRREVAMAELPETAQEVFDALPLRDAVARLPRDLRAVIILRYFDGLTLAQTAETLQIPQGTVATRQRKALSLLRLELTDSEEVGA